MQRSGEDTATTAAGFGATMCGKTVPTDRALVMAIVNRTPDSFFDKGSTFADPDAQDAVRRAVDEGADVIDVGGVKAGPGELVDTAAETARVVPFIGWVRETFPDLLISVDTWRPEVAEAAHAAGADLINDTWAGANPDLVETVGGIGAGLVCSHTGGAAPRTRPHRVRYDDVVADVIATVTAAAEAAVAAGVPADGVLIDPTHDFGKNTFHGLELLRRADELVATGWPVLMALSNKDFLGETLDVAVDQRLEASLAATAVAAAAGARMFRVHQVAPTRRVLETVAAITGRATPRRTVRGLA